MSGATSSIVRLEVRQHDRDAYLPEGSLFRAPKTGATFTLFRRKRRDGCDRFGVGPQTWWVKRGVS